MVIKRRNDTVIGTCHCAEQISLAIYQGITSSTNDKIVDAIQTDGMVSMFFLRKNIGIYIITGSPIDTNLFSDKYCTGIYTTSKGLTMGPCPLSKISIIKKEDCVYVYHDSCELLILEFKG